MSSKNTDINECDAGSDDCVDDATCENTDGSFTCICPTGFTGDGRDSETGCQGKMIQKLLYACHPCIEEMVSFCLMQILMSVLMAQTIAKRVPLALI